MKFANKLFFLILIPFATSCESKHDYLIDQLSIGINIRINEMNNFFGENNEVHPCYYNCYYSYIDKNGIGNKNENTFYCRLQYSCNIDEFNYVVGDDYFMYSPNNTYTIPTTRSEFLGADQEIRMNYSSGFKGDFIIK